MIKFEMKTLKENTAIGDLIVYKGQRVLKITFGEDDAFDANDPSSRIYWSGTHTEDPGGIIYIYGSKLLAMEKSLKIERKNDVNGNTEEG